MNAFATVTPETSPSREIAPGLWWIPACLSLNTGGRSVHVHNAPFLIIGPEKVLLWDTAPPANWSGVEPELDRILGDRQIDYLVPSHPEQPHCGNLHRLFAKYPDVQVLGDVRDYHLYFPHDLDRFESLAIGSEIDLGGDVKFVILPAIVKDLPGSIWGYLTSEQMLFTADAFAYSHEGALADEERPVHSPEDCRKYASEFDTEPGPEQIIWITKAALYWAQFAKMATYREPFEELLRKYPTRMVGPAHGAVIDDMSILPVIWDALDLAYEPANAPGRGTAYLPTFDRNG